MAATSVNDATGQPSPRARHFVGVCTGSLAMAAALSLWPGWDQLGKISHLVSGREVITLLLVLALAALGLWGRRSSLLGVVVGLMAYPAVRWANQAFVSWCIAGLPGPISVNRDR